MKLNKSLIFFVLALPLHIFADLSARLADLQTYQANFSQKTYDAKGKLVQRGRGQVYLKRPGLFRWQTQNPTQQIIIAKSNWLWTYDVDLQQVSKQRLTAANDLATKILVGESDKALKDFTIKTIAQDVYLLHPKAKSNIKSIKLSFKAKVMVAMEVDNSFDQITRFKFTNIKYNKPISSTKFSTVWPKDVDVVEAG